MTKLVRCKYVHIWSSEEEVRVKCTDPGTLEAAILAIRRSGEKDSNFAQLQIERHKDISGLLNVISIKGFPEASDYPRLAWWLFRALCDKGWEPMYTGERTYKLIFRELAD